MDGVYALASLDGAPLDAGDGAVLELRVPPHARFVVELRDAERTAHHGGEGWAFLGHLSEPDAVAAALGLDRPLGEGELAMAALDRWGERAPARLLGEWSLVRWDAPSATLTLAASEPVRDTLLFASDGRRVAVASDIHRLRRLPWVDKRWDAEGLLLHLGRGDVRAALAGQTVVRGIGRVQRGTVVMIGRAVRASWPAPWQAPAARAGGPDDLLAEAGDLLRRIVERALAPHGCVALLLSGGLDSSLLAVEAAAVRRPDQPLVALASAAPPFSNFPDELPFGRMVAATLGLPIEPVWPGGDADFYRPTDRMLRSMAQPLTGTTPYLFDALFGAAVRAGAGAVVDGAFGELTVSGYGPPAAWRERFFLARQALVARVRDGGWRRVSPQAGFHPRLSPAVLELARDLVDRPAARLPRAPLRSRGDLWGYLPGVWKNLDEPSGTGRPGLRRILPFRDRRLLDLFAAVPARFSVADGLGRAPARALLEGRVPDAIRLRPRGLPFSPDYLDRAGRDAAAARARIANHREAGIGDWLDLDWLDGALAAIARSGPGRLDQLIQVQVTAVAAEYMNFCARN